MIEEFYLFAFDSTHAAIAAQRLLTPVGAVLLPTLREITASCGMSLRISKDKADRALELMNESGIVSWHYYKVKKENRKYSCEMITKAEND